MFNHNTTLKTTRQFVLTFFLVLPLNSAFAQGLLGKYLSVDVKSHRVADVLTEISKKGEFHFSYGGQNFPKDSLVTFKADNQTVSQMLTTLLGDRYEFEERRNYIIITPALQRLSFINTDVTSDNNNYSISGIVVNVKTGQRLMNTSVYEKEQLVSTITDEHGYFRLKLRSNSLDLVRITASKYAYRDTSLSFLNTVVISNRSRARIFNHNGRDIEATALGRIFTTAAQRIQSINIQDFFANRPFQVSVTPGLSSHGALSSQVINKFSLNLAGGYTAGVDGLEVGGLFNINKRDTRYLQLAGVFNLVGGTVTGMQLAGVSNQALDTVKGVQLAGFINTAESQVSGLQLSALNNRAHKLKGVQIGLVNQADSSTGASIGLLNIVNNGFYRVSMSASSMMPVNFSFASGTRDFYTLVHVGGDPFAKYPQLSMGLGIGHDFIISRRVFASASLNYHVSGENITFQDKLKQGKLLLNAQLSNKVSVYAGPVYNIFKPKWRQTSIVSEGVTYPNYYYDGNYQEKSLGWEAGVSFNSIFKAAPKAKYNLQNWYLGVAALAGVDIKSTKCVIGTEIYTFRNLTPSMAATLSLGYALHIAKPAFPPPAWYPGLISYSYYEDKDYHSLPIKVGIRSYAGNHFFFGGELGLQIAMNYPDRYVVLHPDNSLTKSRYGRKPTSLLASFSPGYAFNNGFEAGLRYEFFGSDLDIQTITIRTAFRLRL
jgi:hypothetical protein